MPQDDATSLDRASALSETLVAVSGLGEPDPEHPAAVFRRVPPEVVAGVLLVSVLLKE